MKKYILKRIFTGFLSVVISFVITFFLVKTAPGDPIRLLTGKENPNPELVQHLTEYYGLDKPLTEQFSIYVRNLLNGDFGYSYVSNKPVREIITARLPVTLLLSTTSVLLSMILGVLVAVISSIAPGKWISRIMDGINYVLDPVPTFWLGLILMLVFASWLKWLPTSGMYNVREMYTGWRYYLDVAEHMILPLMTLVFIQAPGYYKIFRSAVEKTMAEDYISIIQATGIRRSKLFAQFVLKNSILPIITVAGLNIAFSISGVTMTEIVFSWQGMGRLLMDAIGRRDHLVLLGAYLIISICVCVFTILTDILYALVNPQVRYE